MSRRFCVAVSFTLKEEIDFEKETKDMMKVMEKKSEKNGFGGRLLFGFSKDEKVGFQAIEGQVLAIRDIVENMRQDPRIVKMQIYDQSSTIVDPHFDVFTTKMLDIEEFHMEVRQAKLNLNLPKDKYMLQKLIDTQREKKSQTKGCCANIFSNESYKLRNDLIP